MPALDYDYDYYEYRNGRRVGSVASKPRTTSTNRAYATPKTTTTRRTTSQVAKPTTRKVATTRTATVKKQATTNKKVAVQKSVVTKKKQVTTAKPKATNVKKSKIDIPLESSKKLAKKPEAVKLSAKTNAKTNSTNTLKNLALVSVFFCLFFMVCYRYSLINEQFSNIKKLKSELLTIQTSNEQIQADIESKTDLTYVENYAKYQLGMQKPSNSQIQYVHVDKQDKITTPVSISEEQEMNWFESLIYEIRKIID